jgi:hypothetical protein
MRPGKATPTIRLFRAGQSHIFDGVFDRFRFWVFRSGGESRKAGILRGAHQKIEQKSSGSVFDLLTRDG